MASFDQRSTTRLADTTAAPDWLSGFRARSAEMWHATTLPHSKTEDWRHTSLASLTSNDYLRFGELDESAIEPGLFELAELDGTRLVFVNGVYSEALSCTTDNAGGQITRFSEADDSQQALIDQYLGQVAPQDHPFTSLNGSWLDDGLLCHFDAPGRSAPLHVVNVCTTQSQHFTARHRLLVIAEAGSEGTVIEHFTSTADVQNSFTNSVTELVLNDDAQLTHYRLHLEEEHAIHIGGVYAQLQRNARLNSFSLALGGQLKRLDMRIQHQAPGSECQLNGVYLSKGQQHVELRSTVEHESPHGTTAEVFRGIVDDEARAIFNGRIHIHPQAQKTLAELSNRNLLLSNRAEIYTKPELEIYADDVRCAHGATVSQIEDQALYYMQSRGIDRKEAEVMLSFGFINELLDQLPHAPVRARLRPLLGSWFGKGSNLTRHLL